MPLLAGPGVQKLYLAIVEEGERLEDRGFVGPTVGQTQGLPATKTTNSAQAAKAEEEQLVLTQYTTLARCQEKFALLALQPITGLAPCQIPSLATRDLDPAALASNSPPCGPNALRYFKRCSLH